MARYDFTAQAERDLENITDYTVATWGAAQAEKYIAGLENLAQELANNPKVGVRCEHLANGLLSFPFTSHVLYYVEQAHGITIIRVLHKHMLPERHIEEYKSGSE